jgi:hypothetical protein
LWGVNRSGTPARGADLRESRELPLNGRQQVAIASGSALFAFTLP